MTQLLTRRATSQLSADGALAQAKALLIAHDHFKHLRDVIDGAGLTEPAR
jgi:hypothetical protein